MKTERQKTLDLCRDVLRQKDLGNAADQLSDLEATLILTERERDVTSLVAIGLTTKEAASKLGVCPKTVEIHKQRIYRVLGFSGAVKLAHWALRQGVVRNLFGERFHSTISLSEIDVVRVVRAWQGTN